MTNRTVTETVNVMQIALGRTGDYGVRAVLDVACHYPEQRRKTREIAAAMNIPLRYLSQILALLVRADILKATAGPTGGYELARDPADLRLLDVVEVVEGAVTLERCVLRGIPCSSDGICAVHEAWAGAQDAMVERLSGTNFAELVEREAEFRRAGTVRPS